MILPRVVNLDKMATLADITPLKPTNLFDKDNHDTHDDVARDRWREGTVVEEGGLRFWILTHHWQSWHFSSPGSKSGQEDEVLDLHISPPDYTFYHI